MAATGSETWEMASSASESVVASKVAAEVEVDVAVEVEASFPLLAQKIARVDAAKSSWAALLTAERVAMGRRLLERYHAASPAMVAAACEAKMILPSSSAAAEEWLAGPLPFLRTTRLLLDELDRRAVPGASAHPLGASGVTTRIVGEGETSPAGTAQRVVTICPTSRYDKLLFPGTTATIWVQPDEESEGKGEAAPGAVAAGADAAAGAESGGGSSGGGEVALVLGAGNVSSIGPLDCINKLFVEDSVCVLKMSPVNDYLTPFFAEAFGEFIERGFLEICGGGATEGAFLAAHPLIGAIHITGSHKTHDAIVFGGSGGAAAAAPDATSASRVRINPRRITSELGNVSPVIIVPPYSAAARWSASSILFHAENVATMLANNAAFNCNAARVIVTSKNWAQRDEFLDALRKVYRARIPPRRAYYPGAVERYVRWTSDATAQGFDVEQLGAVFDTDEAAAAAAAADGAAGTEGGGASESAKKKACPPVLPWTLITNVPPDSNSLLFREESFCSIQCETSLATEDSVDAFLDAAVDFCNTQLWGTLNACIIVDSATESAAKARVESAIAQLRYGTVAVNCFPGVGYGLGTATWGGFPGQEDIDAVQSGIGCVHNAWLVQRPQKTVLRMPFAMSALSGRPPWFATATKSLKIAPPLCAFEAAPSFGGFAKVLLAATF